MSLWVAELGVALALSCQLEAQKVLVARAAQRPNVQMYTYRHTGNDRQKGTEQHAITNTSDVLLTQPATIQNQDKR